MRRWQRWVASGVVVIIATGCGSNPPSDSPASAPSSGTPDRVGGSPAPASSAAQVEAPTNGGKATPTTSASLPGVDDAVWDVPADPLHVSVDLDAAAATKETVDKAGGTLTTVARDGSRYTLTIPPQRVWQATTITMTPIVRLTAAGKVAGPGVVFGVQLEPSGLQLSADASLRIEPATPLDERELAYFGYDGTGDDAGLEVPDTRTDGHVLDIVHFSGAGFVHRTGPAGGTDAESGVYEVLLDRVATRIIDNRLASVMGRELGREREKQLAGQEPDMDALSGITARWLASYLERVVKPLLIVAANPGVTCDEASEAAAAVFNAQRQQQLLGMADDPATAPLMEQYDAAREQALTMISAACRREAARECQQTGDLRAVLRRAFGEARMMQLLGVLGDAEFAALMEAYRSILRWCGVYELAWVSTGKIANPRYTISSRIEGHMTLRYVDDESRDLADIRLEGATKSALVPFLSHVGCTSYENRMLCPPGADLQAPTTGVVTELQLRVQVTKQVGSQQVIETEGENKLMLEFGPSAMVLETSVKTPVGPIPVPLEIYKDTWFVAHSPDVVDGVFRITDWERNDHPLMFSKTYTGRRSKQGSTFSDATEFRFTHTPDPPP